MTENPSMNAKEEARRPDCVTEVRMGNTVLVVSGYFKKDAAATAADKMMKVLEAEAAAPCGMIFIRNRGAAVGNGGFYVKTSHPKDPYHSPLRKIEQGR